MSVELLDVVAKESGLARASEFGCGGNVGVRNAGGEVEEEGLLGVAFDEGEGLVGEGGLDLVFNAGFG